jgi:hypothetical protein
MPEPDRQLAEWIAERLRYRALHECIGRACEVSSLKALQAEISDCLVDQIPNINKFTINDRDWIKQSLREYGIVDLTFDVPAEWLNADYDTGMPLLDALGFWMDAEEVEQFEYVASLIGDNFEDPTLLGELKADLEDQHTVLRLILRGGETFPQTLTIEDACITNAASVWLYKHPYF